MKAMHASGNMSRTWQLNTDVVTGHGAKVMFGSRSHEKGKAMIKISPNINAVY